MEKDIGKVRKSDNTDIVVRIDDFGGRVGLTIREFVNKSESGYTGFTKSGTRIPVESFEDFKNIINSINPEDFKVESQEKSPEIQEESLKEESLESGDESLI